MRMTRLAAITVALIAGMGSAAGADETGSLVIYGNYCGPGQRGVNPRPVDALDAACMRHDACTPVVGLAACACHERLARRPGRSPPIRGPGAGSKHGAVHRRRRRPDGLPLIDPELTRGHRL